MKRIFIFLISLIFMVLLGSCKESENIESNYKELPYGLGFANSSREYLKKEFLDSNYVGNAINETEDGYIFVSEDEAPKNRYYIIRTFEEHNKIFSGGPTDNYDEKVVIIYIFGYCDCRINIDDAVIENKHLKIICNREITVTTNPKRHILIFSIDKVVFETVEVEFIKRPES